MNIMMIPRSQSNVGSLLVVVVVVLVVVVMAVVGVVAVMMAVVVPSSIPLWKGSFVASDDDP